MTSNVLTSIDGIGRRYVTCNLKEGMKCNKKADRGSYKPACPRRMSNNKLLVPRDSVSDSPERVQLILATFDYAENLLQRFKLNVIIQVKRNILTSLKVLLENIAVSMFP